jgi:hypothetical protein
MNWPGTIFDLPHWSQSVTVPAVAYFGLTTLCTNNNGFFIGTFI